MLLSVSGQTSPSQATAILSGAAAGAAESFIVAPFEKVKIRMQDLNSLHRYASSVDCFRKTLRAEGVATFFKGLVATVYWYVWVLCFCVCFCVCVCCVSDVKIGKWELEFGLGNSKGSWLGAIG